MKEYLTAISKSEGNNTYLKKSRLFSPRAVSNVIHKENRVMAKKKNMSALAVILTPMLLTLYLISGIEPIYAQNLDLTIWIYHSGSGESKICLDSKGYPEKCEVYNLFDEENPFAIRYEVEDPKMGKEFTVCFEMEKAEEDECKTFEFEEDTQEIDVNLPDFNKFSDNTESIQSGPKEGVDQSSRDNILIYKNSQHGIEINYPVNFEVVQGDQEPTDRVEYIATFFQPFQSVNDIFQEYYAIISDPISYDRSLEEYLIETIKGYENSFDNYKTIESSTNVIVAGQPGYQLIYSYRGLEPNSERKVLETGTIINGEVYYLEYEAEETVFEKNLAQVTALLTTFQVS